MRLRGLCTLVIVAVWFLLPTGLRATEQADLAVQQSQLDLSAVFERLRDWGKAEAYLQEAAKGPSVKVRAEALKGIERVRNISERSVDNSSLKLANYYATQHLWSEAEKQYLAAAKDGTKEVQRRALEGLMRVRDKIPRIRFAEDLESGFDIVFGLIARMLGALTVLAVVMIAFQIVRQIQRRIEVLPFVVSNEANQAQITYWLSYAQAMVQSTNALPIAGRTTGPSSVLPYLQLPGLQEKLPDLGELSVSGVKLPVNELLQRFGRPRVRISGGWTCDASHGTAFAQLERRRGLFRYEPYASIKREIPVHWQDQELELFAYHILIKAAETYVS